jgi:2-(1,2-epoxy-1,2-dihydrophenyl)acetyl-CoA isomerase
MLPALECTASGGRWWEGEVVVEAGSPPRAGSADAVVHEVRDGVLWITLNRPEVGNAVTAEQRDRMIELFEAAGADRAVRAVVLGAAGDRFCTGADLRPSGGGGADAFDPAVVGDTARLIRRGAQRLVAAILDCEKPVVAAVNGTAAGLGAHLAFACDLVVAAERARFIEVFVRRGIAPDAGGAYLLARLVGPHRAKELVLLGDDLDATTAHQWGLVNRVVPDDELPAAVAAIARRLAEGPTPALAAAKWLVNRAADVDRRTAFDDEALAQELVVGSADAAEGLRAFAERRPPRFQGR